MRDTRKLAVVATAVVIVAAACSTAAGSAVTCEIPNQERIETVTMEFDGLVREYDIVAPASTEPLPVVLAFHGFTQSSQMHQDMTDLGDAAFEQGFIAVFPMGSVPDGAWRPYFNFDTIDDASLADDIGFAEAILADVASSHCVDDTRTYASGWSNGGLMAAALACKLPGAFAAVSSVSGVFLPDDCPEEPVPIIIHHGTSDSVMPYSDAPDGHMAGVAADLGGDESQVMLFDAIDEDPDDYIQQWLDHNGCEEPPAVAEDLRLEIFEYEACSTTVVVAEAGGHRWAKYPTQRILDFLFEHQLAAGE